MLYELLKNHVFCICLFIDFRDLAKKWNKVVGEVETPFEHCSHVQIFPEHLWEHKIESQLRYLENLRDQIETQKSETKNATAKVIEQHLLFPDAYRCKTHVGRSGPDMSEFGQESLTIGNLIVELEVRSRGPIPVSHTGQKTFLPLGEMDLE